MNNKWVRAALVKNLPRTITQHLAVELGKASTTDAIYNLVMVHMHDHNTGLPRGQTPAKLHLTEEDDNRKEKQKDNQKEKQTEEVAESTWSKEIQQDFNAVPKGGKKGRGKGYGQHTYIYIYIYMIILCCF